MARLHLGNKVRGRAAVITHRGAVAPILHALFRGLHDGLRQRRRLDQAGSGPSVHHAGGRTAHIDVDAVKAKLAEHHRRAPEEVGRVTEDLGNDGTLALVVEIFFEQRAVAHLQPLDCGELGVDHHRVAVFLLDLAKRMIGDAIHRRQSDQRAGQCVPESGGHGQARSVTHLYIISGLRQSRVIPPSARRTSPGRCR